MQRASGVKEGSQIVLATPEQKALHLLQVWLERDMVKRANPGDQQAQRRAHMALCDLREQAERLRSKAASY